MRWIPFFILAYLVVLLQVTAVRLIVFSTSTLGAIGPDLTALVVVFVAFYVRNWPDAMIAAWALGLMVDMTAAGGPGGPTVVGPMALAYALTAGLLFRVLEAFFREQPLTQTLLAGAFCLLAHAFWVTAQSLLAAGHVGWVNYWRTMGQAAALAGYSALLMPLAHWPLHKCRRWLMTAPVGPGRKSRR